MQPTRRQWIGGVAATGMALGLSGPALAAPSPTKRLFANIPLAHNLIAGKVERLDLLLPDIPVLTATGPAKLSGVGGKTRLLSLWAVWCVPCLIEIRDFAKLRPQFANDRFDIGLLATASGAAFDRAAALDKLRQLGASAMPLLIEEGGGGRIATDLATPAGGNGFSLPCTLLVDAHGRVRGRLFGAPSAPHSVKPQPSPPADVAKPHVVVSGGKAVAMSEADKDWLASSSTSWTGPDGLAFLRALQQGALDRV